MQATGILMSEHRVIERAIAALQAASGRLEAGQAVRPGFFVDAADFIKGYADGCHHEKEEGILFSALATESPPSQSDLLRHYMTDHVQGRQYSAAMREAAERLEAGDDSARADVIANAKGYSVLLLGHIRAEDTKLFPTAEKIIPPGQQKQVDESFEYADQEEAGKGLHEKYLALADRLAAEAATV